MRDSVCVPRIAEQVHDRIAISAGSRKIRFAASGCRVLIERFYCNLLAGKLIIVESRAAEAGGAARADTGRSIRCAGALTSSTSVRNRDMLLVMAATGASTILSRPGPRIYRR
jgi:hypothetical protein